MKQRLCDELCNYKVCTFSKFEIEPLEAILAKFQNRKSY